MRAPREQEREAGRGGDVDGEVRPLLGRVPAEVEQVAVLLLARRVAAPDAARDGSRPLRAAALDSSRWRWLMAT